jgi:hypothetical protein
MDLNQHYARHQRLLMRAARASTAACKDALRDSAALLAGQIAIHQHGLGAAAAPGWNSIAPGAAA